MKHQRDAFDMGMGPIENCVVEDNVAAIIYRMYLTPKGVENPPTYGFLVTEYNTFEQVDGYDAPMVTKLELYTDGFGGGGSEAGDDEFEALIKERLYRAWDEWLPGYEDWLNWSSNLYAADAVIYAIGDEPQLFSVYQDSMGDQRAAFDMDLGPIENCVAEGNMAAIIYRMYMTPKGEEHAPTYEFLVTEYNTFEYVDGYDEPMVTKLELYTGGF